VQRTSILEAERDIANLLTVRDQIKESSRANNPQKDALLNKELKANEEQIRARVLQLWHTRLLRFTKLTVADEIENALTYYETTFLREIPKIYAQLEDSLSGNSVASFLKMGQWIGGDRDGNPNVSAATLEYAVSKQAEMVLRHYLTEVHYLGRELSVSALLLKFPKKMQELAAASPDTNEHRQDEPYRRALTGMYSRLAAEIANAYRLPILILPQTAVPPLTPAPSVWYNGENIAASGGAHNGMVSYQIIADILELEGTTKQKKQGKLFNDSVRPEFDKFKSTIKTGK
jgi:phosphoenolpyruvate carboxylase